MSVVPPPTGRRMRGPNPISEFFRGFGTLIRGFSYWRRRPRLMALGLIPAAIVFAILVVLIALLAFNLDAITTFLTAFADSWDEMLARPAAHRIRARPHPGPRRAVRVRLHRTHPVRRRLVLREDLACRRGRPRRVHQGPRAGLLALEPRRRAARRARALHRSAARGARPHPARRCTDRRDARPLPLRSARRPRTHDPSARGPRHDAASSVERPCATTAPACSASASPCTSAT